jgi:CheY-like chemotaxis protein
MDEETILLVEDNPDDELLILRTMEKNHIWDRIAVAHDGVEAPDYQFGTETHDGRDMSSMPQVILLDLKLPRLDGLKVLRRLRDDERTNLPPVVILTSSDEDRDIIESYRLGANSYIRKLIDFTQFADTVRQLSLYWLVLNQLPSNLRGNT